jgi:hypothetical protein
MRYVYTGLIIALGIVTARIVTKFFTTTKATA